jgi:predicted permease
MKLFKDITNWPNNYLLKTIQRYLFAMFSMGLMIGLSIVMAGTAKNNNDYEGTLILIGSVIFFLLITAIFYTFVNKKIIPELNRRLKDK